MIRSKLIERFIGIFLSEGVMNEVEHMKNKLVPHIRSARNCKYFRDFKWVAVNRDGMVAIYTQKPLAGGGGSKSSSAR